MYMADTLHFKFVFVWMIKGAIQSEKAVCLAVGLYLCGLFLLLESEWMDNNRCTHYTNTHDFEISCHKCRKPAQEVCLILHAVVFHCVCLRCTVYIRYLLTNHSYHVWGRQSGEDNVFSLDG